MARLGGLQMVKPSFNWGASDKLTELDQFKVDCHILFNGLLCDLKDKQWAGLLVNWLGREAIQILASVESDVSTTEEVFGTLEKVFRPESNQTLAHFKFRNMTQKSSQMCDSYLSQLWLGLPECRYRNDADELFKDQFIFGIHNKEIQDHLLGKIKETDNSVRALYEARKIESKLAQRQMLGIVNPGLVSVDALSRSNKQVCDCDKCGRSYGKRECAAYGKDCYKCGGKNHFGNMCRFSKESKTKSESKHDSRRLGQAKGKFSKCKCNVHEINEINECHDDMNDLTEQVQSLFYN